MLNEKGENIAAVVLEKEDVLDLDITLATIIFQGLSQFRSVVSVDPFRIVPGGLLREMFPLYQEDNTVKNRLKRLTKSGCGVLIV